jgi:hypothetical protein
LDNAFIGEYKLAFIAGYKLITVAITKSNKVTLIVVIKFKTGYKLSEIPIPESP